jgi:hypothetical protein
LVVVKITSAIRVELVPNRLDEILPVIGAVINRLRLFLILGDDVVNVDIGVQMVRLRG